MRLRWVCCVSALLVIAAFFLLAWGDRVGTATRDELGPFPSGDGDAVVVTPRAAP